MADVLPRGADAGHAAVGCDRADARRRAVTNRTLALLHRRRPASATVAAMRLALLVVLLLTGVAGADVYKSKAAKVSIDIPKKWSVTATDELIRAASPNNEVGLVLWVIEKADVKAALEKLEAELYSSVSGLKWVDKVKKLKVNKIKGSWVEGVGVSSRSTKLDVIVFVA